MSRTYGIKQCEQKLQCLRLEATNYSKRIGSQPSYQHQISFDLRRYESILLKIKKERADGVIPSFNKTWNIQK